MNTRMKLIKLEIQGCNQLNLTNTRTKLSVFALNLLMNDLEIEDGDIGLTLISNMRKVIIS